MKQYIKDNKIYNAPIKIKNGDEIIISSDAEFLKQYGYEVYISQPAQISLEDEIKMSNERINKETDEKILNDFVWNDNEFYLTMENQQNFANMYLAKEILTFPQTVKTKTGFAIIENVGELSGFYFAGVTFIKKCLEEGWQRKTDAEEEIRKNYK